jgi:peptidoglycan/LPS O-acetylase OafA/YrhL
VRSQGRLRALQISSFALFAALLVATIVRWATQPAGQVRWFLTPAAFAVLLLALSLAFALTLLRRPARPLALGALVLLLVAAVPAWALDLSGAALAPLFGVAACAVGIFACTVIGEHRLRRGSSVALVVVGALSLCTVLGLSACASVGTLWGGRTVFAQATSPDGTWTATGYQTNMLATDSGSTEVLVRRDLAGVIRGELSAYDVDGLTEPQLSWRDGSHLRVGHRVFVLPFQ